MVRKLLPKVSIVLSDHNWILERLGREIADRIPKVTLNDQPDPSADINYYITFACRQHSVPTLEMAFFAHMEQSDDLMRLFYQTAREIDLPVTQNKIYRDMLHNAGISNAITIPPGVDHDRFQPKLRIGVVGRAYHTGRKGEAILAELMNMPGIDWHFTGKGWPLPGRTLSDEELPDFYRSMDYILVPALYEGGPMCVPEALAAGTPVISSNVGWVKDFPHIPFETGNSEDLRRVLNDLLEIKLQRHQSTLSYTWDRFAQEHDRAFHDLIRLKGSKRATLNLPPLTARPIQEPVRLLMHGSEATSLGGPSVRVPRTAKALSALGIQARSDNYKLNMPISENLVHLFNLWGVQSALEAMRALKAAGKTVVFSPIYLNLSERDFWDVELADLVVKADEKTLAARYGEARALSKRRGLLAEPLPGSNAMIREMIDLADHIIFLSENERENLRHIGVEVEDKRMSLIRNPVDVELWQKGDPALFQEAYLKDLEGPEEYVICVGRIEPRKNQLMLARAMKGLNLRLVLVGHVGNSSYADKIRKLSGDQLLMVGRLPAGGEMLRSAIAGAKVFVLPSWSEGASLAALEAAASGVNMVLSDRSSEVEYFGDLATYCDPGDLKSLRFALERALVLPDAEKRGLALQALVRECNSWSTYAEETAKAYARVLANGPKERPRKQEYLANKKPQLVFDITTLAHHSGRITGISRVEAELAAEFRKMGGKVRFITWVDSLQHFSEVPEEYATMNQAYKYRVGLETHFRAEPVVLSAQSTIYVAGSAWMQNQRYPVGLEMLKSSYGCGLILHIYDLIPFKFPFWFDKGYAPVFRQNFTRVGGIADHIVTISKNSAEDIRAVMASLGLPAVDLSIIRHGDPTLGTSAKTAPSAPVHRMAGKKFVLAVGAIHIRKNYEMLYRVWARYADENCHVDLHLVIVGGVAWNGNALADTIAADPRVKDKIHVLSNVSDSELAGLYENCLFTVFPSHYEGWGLPVAESLLKGKVCLASSASSVPEIAPDVVEHIDPEDFLGWHHKISFYAGSAKARAVREGRIKELYQPVSYSQTASEIIDVVQRAHPRKLLTPAMPGQALPLTGPGLPLRLHYGANWRMEGTSHMWMQAPKASLSVNVSKVKLAQKSGVYLLINQSSHPTKYLQEQYRVSCNGVTLFESLLSQKSLPKQLLVYVSADLIGPDHMVQLDFEMPLTATPAQSEHAGAMRGLGLKSITLLDPKWSNPLQYLEESENWILGDDPWMIHLEDEKERTIVAADLVYMPPLGIGSPHGPLIFHLPLLPRSPSQILTINYRSIADADHPVDLTFALNGEPLAKRSHIDAKQHSCELLIPQKILQKCSPSVLSITSNSLWSAEELGLIPSSPFAGLEVKLLSFVPKDR